MTLDQAIQFYLSTGSTPASEATISPALLAEFAALPVLEVWRDVPGWEGLYQVSDQGRVRSLDRAARRGRVLKPCRRGFRLAYHAVSLYRAGKRTIAYVHITAALAFLGPQPTPQHEVAHGNGDPTNNRLINLRWATPAENAADKVLHGTVVRGEGSASSRLTVWDVCVAHSMADAGEDARAIAETLGMSRTNAHRIITGRAWAHIPRKAAQ